MKKCKQCNVLVDTNRKICPLCFNALEDIGESNNSFENYPKRTEIKKNKNLIYKMIIFICIIAISVSLLVNFLTHTESSTWWSLYVVCGVVYAFILIKSTIYARINMLKKLLIQELFISLVIVAIDIISGNHGWGLAIVVPGICIATTIASICIILLNKKNFGESFMTTFIIILLGVIPFILQLFGLIKGNTLWAPISSCLFSILILLGFILFFGKEINEELHKRFHI